MASDKKHLITDYVRTQYLVPETSLEFDIFDDNTIVKAEYVVEPVDPDNLSDLVLNGDATVELLSLQSVRSTSDGCVTKDIPHEFVTELGEKNVVIRSDVVKTILRDSDGSNSFMIAVVCKIHPEMNTELQGLYLSNNVYCTQCEPHGFRRIVYSFDRPDVLSRYTVKITTDKAICPVVLSNGNPVTTSAELEDVSRRSVVWNDPHPKPSYLFALVAGDLGFIETKYKSSNQKEVTIRIYASHDKVNQLDHAMNSIVQAFMWDENRYGLFYDLELFNIVCLDDFNMGAMENKGLNIFNSKYILTTHATATDADHEAATGVIGHEYFHNWTGNRVTLEKWFDLTLKEGLTVYRDQNFSMDVGSSRDQQIIDRAIDLRNSQFSEDAGPNAHPIRPRSYKVMDNFYTSTVYEKGAEIIRIYETLLGVEGFRKGMDLYFKRHDGCAVACEDFWRAMFDANVSSEYDAIRLELPMRRLLNWYHQPGTPRVKIDYLWNSDKKQFIVNCEQTNHRCVELNGTFEPVLIPIRIGLVSRQYGEQLTEIVLPFCELKQEFVIDNINEDCIPSFMRDFSAPVTTEYGMSLQDRLFLIGHDQNMFNRWEQSQIIHKTFMVDLYNNNDAQLEAYLNLLSSIVTDETLDPSLKSSMLKLPLQDEMFAVIEECDPIRLHEEVVLRIYRELSQRCREYIVSCTNRMLNHLTNVNYSLSKKQVSERVLFRTMLEIRFATFFENDVEFLESLFNIAVNSNNLTIIMSVVSALSNAYDTSDIVASVLMKLIDCIAVKYPDNRVMTSKWLRWISRIPSRKTVKILTNLFNGEHLRSGMISKTTPNHLYALVSAFTMNPYVHLISVETNKDGTEQIRAPGYEYVTNCLLEIDPHNGIVASRIAGLFDCIKQLSPKHREVMQQYIDKIKSVENLSENVREVLH